MFDVVVGVAVFAVIWIVIHLCVRAAYPHKLTPADFEDPETWGEQPRDVRRARVRHD